ncbi:hypothetical protein BGZ54_004404 [Gamsiella multidivaricata]|nr:hypothetical protein BGZ54_004404 [Gamsiella multidivaricata]
MKISTLSAASALVLASVVAGQNSTQGDGLVCTTCLQNSLRALPLCKDLNITVGDFNPGVSTAYAACLCSSLSGTWIDACKDASQCGPDIESFKATYPSTIEQAGLQCNGSTPTFVPATPDPVAPSTAPPAGASPTGSASSTGKPSAGNMDALPSTMFTKIMGAVAVVAAVAASFI